MKALTRSSHVAVAPEVLQELDLTQGALGQDLLAEDIGDLLDGNTLVGLVIHCRATKVSSVVLSWYSGATIHMLLVMR
jgi:hypothetical protein